MKNNECPNPACTWRCSKGNMEFFGSCGARFNAVVHKTTSEIKITIEASFPAELLLQEVALNQTASIPASTSDARLVVTYGGRIGQEFPLIRKDTSIGRRDKSIDSYPDIDLTIDDPACYVSRKHAHILYRSGKYFLEDLGSTNYTMLNKTKLKPYSPQELKNGDGIILGNIFFIFTTM